ncbi:MAG TPA: fumarylacetoacetate hydrolase family protein [Luteimonas sp.]|nr:fumarylacetoacetate hydrolase family protein [Luteimonas sp.]
MKLASFLLDGRERVGLVIDDGRAVRPVVAPLSMLDLIALAEAPATGDAIPLADVQLLAPLPRPARSIFCVGKNYRDHAQEFVRSGFDVGADPDHPVEPDPVIFTKLASSVAGPHDHVELHPAVTREVDYEGELAVVIGRPGRNIRASGAMTHVFGYTLLNDVTARDLQKRHRQWTLAKSLDTFCPMGPWITIADEVDPERIELTTHVNGELRQRRTASDMIHAIPALIEVLSAGIALQPGDIIATGTPAGVGIGFDPPRFLRPGDVVTVSADGLGSISNRFQ